MSLITHNPRHEALDPKFTARRSERGSTVLEFLIYIALISVVLTTATLFASEMLRSQAKSAALSEVVRNARFAMSRIEIETREASDLNIGASTFGANPSTLSLATAGGTDPTIFTVTGGALTIKQGAGAAIPLTNTKVTVTEFTIDNISTSGKTRAIRIHIKAIAKNPDALVEQTADTTVESTVRIHAKDGFGN